MKKFIFTPIWNVEKTEKILSDFEKNGYRLVNFRFPYIFEFKKSSPKDAMYLFTKYYRNDGWHISFNQEYQLKSKQSCSPIGKFEPITGYNVYRTLKDVDFTEFKRIRADFFRRLYRRYLIGDIAFLVLFSVLFILSMHGDNGGKRNTMFIIVFMFLILHTAYCLFGYLKERKTYNYYTKLNKDNKKASE